ncbi:hypothetical protein [Peptostreptococcus porci]|uniref:hypothetical protein n=1 Tax=Peptostreptococcus porci TaxID=2652282 RepID=UPI002A7F4CE6|nr:hypothetical protein [Peptostreptococcus porci]MDY4127684.1 hypothetical protein [Peptostreptococcus porci]
MYKFKIGDIIHCKTMDEANELFKILKEQGIHDSCYDIDGARQRYKERTYYEICGTDDITCGDITDNEKTFQEVMTFIKPGETWITTWNEWDVKSITMNEFNEIMINKHNADDRLQVPEMVKFKLKKPKYTIQITNNETNKTESYDVRDLIFTDTEFKLRCDSEKGVVLNDTYVDKIVGIKL